MKTTMMSVLILGAFARAAAADDGAAQRGREVSVLVGPKQTVPGMMLEGGAAGWEISAKVTGEDARCVAVLTDISAFPFPVSRKPRVESPSLVVGQSVTFALPITRYTGAHTFKMSLRCSDGARNATMIVYLQPTPEEQRAWLGEAAPVRLARR